MQANLATFGTRFKAAVVDAVVVVMLTGPPILATALLFPRHVAIPFFTATKTEVLDQKEVREEGVKVTTVDYIEWIFDLRGSLISECRMTKTTRESGNVTTSVSHSVAPCRGDVAKLDNLIWLVILVYGTYFEMRPRSATLGKRLLKLRVVRTDNAPLSFGRALWRNVAEFLSYVGGIGYLVALFTRRRQTIHDLLAKTIVVRLDGEGNARIDAGAPEGNRSH